VAGDQVVELAAGWLGDARMQQRGRGHDEHGAGLGLAGWGWGQQQAKVAVSDPAGLEDLTEGVGAELLHWAAPAGWRRVWKPGYPVES
jgi:hypothetical protein